MAWGLSQLLGGMGRRKCCSKRGAALLDAAVKPCAAGAHVGTSWPMCGTCSTGDALLGGLWRGDPARAGWARASAGALLGWVMLRGRAA